MIHVKLLLKVFQPIKRYFEAKHIVMDVANEQHNFQLLKGLAALSITGKPILTGLSRKGTIYNTLGITAADALNGTTVLNTMALLNGACILRVHDVKEAKEAITLFNAYKKAP